MRKMRKMKRLLGLILTMVMLAGMGVSSFATDEEINAFSYSKEAAGKFSSLGIYQETIISDETLSGGRLTRGEFAALMTFLFDVTPASTELTEAPFSDVDIDEVISPYIKAAKDYLKFYGFSDGTFHPNAPILFSQAIRAILSNMGYDVKAEALGGYPNGYLRIANDLKMLSGISKANDDEMTINDYFELLENVIDKGILTVTEVGDSVSFGNENGENILSQYHDIYTVENILNANDITSLKGYSDTDGKRAVIGDTVVNAGDVSVLNLIGYRVRGYYKQKLNEDIGTLVYVEKTQRNNELTVLADDIVRTNSLTTFTYKISEEKTKSIPITTDMQVVVNGVVKPLYAVADIYPADGAITFIDNDGDSKYEIISTFSITSTMILASISEYNNHYYIFDYADPTQKVTVSKNDSYYASVEREGLLVDISELKSMDVLSIAQAPDGSVIIKASTQKFEGVVSEFSDEDVTIGEEKYETSYIFDTIKATPAFDDLEIGINTTFYLDSYGKIVAAQKDKPTMLYGTILQLKDVGSGFESKVMVRILATDGEAYDYVLAEELIFNGTKQTAKKAYETLSKDNAIDAGRIEGSVRQIVMYEKPEGDIITKLSSVTANGDLTYDRSFNIVNYYDYYRGTFSHEAYPTSTTSVFILYDSDDNCVGKIGGYSPESTSVSNVTVYFYNMNENDLTTSVILEHRTGGNTTNQKPDSSTKSYIVKGKVKVVSDDGSQVDALNLVYTDGSETKLYVSNKTNDAVKAEFNKAKVGDIVAFSTDNKNRLNGFKIPVDRNRLAECGFAPHMESVHDYNHGSDAYASMQFPLVSALGYVNKVVGSDVFFTRGSDDTVLRRITVSGAMGLVELKKSDANYIKITPNIEASAIMPGDYIFYRTESNTLVTTWIIRELD